MHTGAYGLMSGRIERAIFLAGAAGEVFRDTFSRLKQSIVVVVHIELSDFRQLYTRDFVPP